MIVFTSVMTDWERQPMKAQKTVGRIIPFDDWMAKRPAVFSKSNCTTLSCANCAQWSPGAVGEPCRLENPRWKNLTNPMCGAEPPGWHGQLPCRRLQVLTQGAGGC
jgi:hypothetical protein